MYADIATLLSVQVGRPRDYAAGPDDRPWRSAIHKSPVAGPVWCGRTNVDGDAQADLRYHGGPDKAVLSYSADHYPRWREELGRDDMSFGAFGENLTIAGLSEQTVCIGDRYAIGDAILEVSQPRGPCWKIARRWGIPDLTARVLKARRTGWYARVLQEGMIAPGPMQLIERPHPEWTVVRAIELACGSDADPGEMRALAALPVLSEAWASALTRRD